MASNRSWNGCNRFNEPIYMTHEYKNCVNDFITFACEHIRDKIGGLIRCPCGNCKNKHYKTLNY